MTDRMKQALTNFIFPLLLFLYPFLKIGQGIDLTDSSYGLVNYLFFPNAGQEWTVATWLANVLGATRFMRPDHSRNISAYLTNFALLFIKFIVAYFHYEKSTKIIY